jgi:hypothetical protein
MSLELDAKSRAAEVRRRLEFAFTQLDSALFSAGARATERAPEVSPWSPLDVAEHVTLTNHFLLKLAEKCARKSANKLARGGTSARIETQSPALEGIALRSFRWEAPEHMLPTGQPGFDTVRLTLRMQREQALGLLERLAVGGGSLHTIRMTVLGPEARLDSIELLAFIALHAERHASQARRILASIGCAAG